MEQRKFQMHEKLLLDVIKKQAGSIQKAILEGVMNSIEAGATKVAVTIGPEDVTIDDDGKGFRSREEVEKFFETFGQPHEASEGKVWAQFRMGRGQMFAFGRNTWRTGHFLMEVDVNKRLGYDLTEGNPHQDGCSIRIDLYDKLTDRDIYAICREAETFCKYVSTPIVVNGKAINTNPKAAKWDKESTDDAYIRLAEKGAALNVYNLGVFVCALPTYTFGIGGTVVSKKRLDVNFARNDIVKSCPVWKRIKATIESAAGIERIKKKKTLTQAERMNAIERLCAGELDYNDALSLPLMVDVAGNAWSASKVGRQFTKWSMAPAGSSKGDKLIQSKIALVLDEENVALFDCPAEELFSTQWDVTTDYGRECKTSFIYRDMEHIPFGRLAQSLDSSNTILPEGQWTPTEALWAKVIDFMQKWMQPVARAIRVGQSETAGAWTDGCSYVVFNRTFLSDHGLKKDGRLNIASLGKVASVLAHELAHDDDSTTNVHGEGFYKKFHDIVLGNGNAGTGLGVAVQRAYLEFQGDNLERAEKNAAEVVQKGKRRENKEAQVALAAYSKEPKP